VVVEVALKNRVARLAGVGVGVVVLGLIGGCASEEPRADPDLLPVACLESLEGARCSVRGSGYVFDYRSGTCRRYSGERCIAGSLFETREECLNTCAGSE
jgi:hypothetical protein